jgi:hypothetical protein
MNGQDARSKLSDPLIEDVRQRRRDLLASCGNDLEALADLIRRREEEHPDRVADPRAPRATRA